MLAHKVSITLLLVPFSLDLHGEIHYSTSKICITLLLRLFDH